MLDLYSVCRIHDGSVLVPADAVGMEMASPFVYEVRDPRVNHVSSCWERALDAGGAPNFSGTFGADNQNFKPNGITDDSIDYEQDVTFGGASPNTFSTAFIPNRPFRSLWELGAIHRGEPYRTLNIANHDRAILDQVKIGPIKKTYGKFNLNSANPAAVFELLKNIDVTTGYDGVKVSNPETETVTAAPCAPPPSPCSYSRGDFATVLAAYYGAGANDRAREALIGRTANLLTTRMDKYSILAVGQALKSLDGAGITPLNWNDVKKTVINPLEYAGGYYSILATQRMLVHVVRDAWRNEYKIVQMQLLED